MGNHRRRPFEVTLAWQDGSRNVLEGWGTTPISAVCDAMSKGGFGAGSAGNLDYWEAKPKPDAVLEVNS